MIDYAFFKMKYVYIFFFLSKQLLTISADSQEINYFKFETMK